MQSASPRLHARPVGGGTDTNGIRLGYTPAATLQAYNRNNPGLRVFRIKENGTYTTQALKSRSCKKENGKKSGTNGEWTKRHGFDMNKRLNENGVGMFSISASLIPEMEKTE